MKLVAPNDEAGIVADGLPPVTGAHRRTLDAIFRHPCAHNLDWHDVVRLIGQIGEASEKPNGDHAFDVAGKRLLVRRPHGKDLTAAEVFDLRQFFEQVGLSPDAPGEKNAEPEQGSAGPSLLVVMDHHAARIYQVDVTSDDVAEHVIKPYDPHHFLHHLVHKDQPRDRGQRATEEPAYYELIAQAVAQAGRIVVIGHGAGKSDAAHHLTAYLKAHHIATYRRIAAERVADLSAATDRQLLDLARQALRPA